MIGVAGTEIAWASPDVLGKMFVDDYDSRGLFFWVKPLEDKFKRNQIK